MRYTVAKPIPKREFHEFKVTTSGYQFILVIEHGNVVIGSMPSMRGDTEKDLDKYRSALFELAIEMNRLRGLL